MKIAKFPLLCDGQRVSSLEQLREHFNLLDVLEHYKTGHLQRWLKSRGFTSQLEKIEAIKASEDAEILSALCLIFEIEADKQMIQEVLESHTSTKKEIKKTQVQTLPISTITPPPPRKLPA
ncbi:hypothetical protein [Helicobacter suis]|uniref:hypothetical protein n=1 Tax=Helicobacter suis TaxID=104628 RepID=UPI0013D14B6F|nr:hypothetical protein [Helicobacter suis]